MDNKEHDQDSDCTVDPETGTCTSCGVLHGTPCEECGGRGYHESSCPTLVAESLDNSDKDQTKQRLGFADVTLMFLEDWKASLLTSDKVCDILLAAAIARGLIPSKKLART